MQGQSYRRGGTRFLSALLVAAAVAAPGQAMAIGLFEAIFGPPRQVYVVPAPHLYPPEFRPAPRPRARAKVVKPRDPDAVGASTRPMKPRLANVTLTPEEQKSPLAKFLGDQSLRRGDLVVTSKGPYVFKGASNARHKLSDFAPAETARNLDKNMRAKVAEITRANRWSASLESTFVPLSRDRKDTKVAGGSTPSKPGATAVVAQDMSR